MNRVPASGKRQAQPLLRGFRRYFTCETDDHMRTVNVLGVQPCVLGRGLFERQPIVLSIILADKDFDAVGGKILMRA